jgi:heme-degrading monooxygenase HmoA
MYARVTLLEIDTIRVPMDAALEVFRSEVLPTLREQSGYRGILVLSTTEGNGVLVSFWSSPEAAEAGGTSGFYPEVLDRYVTMFRSPPGRERYEVRLAEFPVSSST